MARASNGCGEKPRFGKPPGEVCSRSVVAPPLAGTSCRISFRNENLTGNSAAEGCMVAPGIWGDASELFDSGNWGTAVAGELFESPGSSDTDDIAPIAGM